MAVSVFSPAKLNLFLAITGRRADGFHDLVSVAAPLDFGDRLEARSREPGAGIGFRLACEQAGVPLDGTNLVLKAAEAFAAATRWPGGVDFKLTKRIPTGAGLGGGSSNAVAALRALNELSGAVLAEPRLAALATSLGSDCALFLSGAPVVMRGRGGRVELVPVAAAARIRGRRVLLFKPSFGISTPWAYSRMAAAAPHLYLPEADAEARVAAWLRGGAPVEELLFNNMEGVAFDKYVALPVLLEKLRRDFGLAVRMSGSGSACFAMLRDDQETAAIAAAIRAAWGDGAFIQEARLA
jgi:4-diphosphocytidyl-2-C-methyl-D-erythritol kinase